MIARREAKFMADLKRAAKKIIAEFREANGRRKSEEDVQASFTLELLRKLGWGPGSWQINTGTTVRTGKLPDIVLKNDAGFTVLVIESKAPRQELATAKNEEQLFRYCRHEGKYWGVLTNFVEWRLYGVYRKTLFRKYAFHELLPAGADKEGFIDLMSADGLAFLTSLTRERLCKKRGRFDEARVYYPEQEEIRKAFFAQLRGWRKNLRAELFRTYGRRRGADDVDLGTQKILDRLIFIEVCTDKEILPHDVLAAVLSVAGNYYAELKREFRAMDELFDSELFAEHWVDAAAVPDKVIEPIIRGVAEVDFERLPVHVIGEVYEDYLGELLREQGRGVSGKASRTKRKSLGAYYTPAYIVDYIVKNTVGVLLKKAKTEEDIRRIRVLDPACGSGSFLIRAFDEFARAYARVHQKAGTDTLFGFDVKRTILENNLYGVDIDPRAVEIAKLNLMIKALEKTRYQDLKGRKLLPNLSLNIRCGNSLVSGAEGGELVGAHSYAPLLAIFAPAHEAAAAALAAARAKFYATRDDAEKAALLDEVFDYEAQVNDALNAGLGEYFPEPTKVRPFNYTVAFPEVFRQDGFDAVIGNPPYVRQEWLSAQKKYFDARYDAFVPTADLYVTFVERALTLAKKGGRFGYIVSNKWMRARYGAKLRAFVKKFQIEKLVDFGELPVFEEAATFPLVMIIAKRPPRAKPIYAPIKELPAKKDRPDNSWLARAVKKAAFPLEEGALADAGFSLIRKDALAIIEKIKAAGVPLGEYVGGKIYRGILTGFNKAFVIDRAKRDELIAEDARAAEIIKPFVVGDDVRKYHINFRERYLIVTKIGVVIKKYPAVFEHLKQYQKQLEKRWDKGKHWWELRACDYYEEFEKPKIVWPEIAKESRFGWDNENYYFNKTCFIMPSDDFYLLGILNSKITWDYLLRLCPVLGDPDKKGRLTQQAVYVKQIPIKVINNNSPRADVARRDEIAALVEEMLDLNKRLAAAKGDAERKALAAKIRVTDAKIDALVYELYGLTAAEIRVVEGQEA